ncbi:P-loop containing nucleoside triphosphate hydrolase protein [Apiospora arundinis]|uniref:P-loop containing nucleoside triphosphate hydrolase protein n=1 Tax=Apiospora arundinis TaxID=335852 RepID=A0ABR2J3H5_9PEZI
MNQGPSQQSQEGPAEDQQSRREARIREILEQLKNGELQGQVIVIILIGPSGAGKSNFLKSLTNSENLRIGHTLQSGTIHSDCVLTLLRERWFLFIDTPGFGHADYSNANVKAAIFTLLGVFTRLLGGVHGMVYFHDILADRTAMGMRDSLALFMSLMEGIHPVITFITTRWDLVAPKEMAKREERLRELSQTEWKAFFRVNNQERPLKFGASYDLDSPEERAMAKTQWTNQMVDRYQHAPLISLNMPFLERTLGEQALFLGQTFGAAVGSTIEFVLEVSYHILPAIFKVKTIFGVEIEISIPLD